MKSYKRFFYIGEKKICVFDTLNFDNIMFHLLWLLFFNTTINIKKFILNKIEINKSNNIQSPK